jgi:chitodextrinase
MVRKIIMALAVVGLVGAAGVAHAQSDTTPPSTPTGISASLAQYGEISVSWNASIDDTGVTGYYLYRNGAEVANIVGTSYTDTVAPGAVYSYTVAAYDAAGNISFLSAPSAPVSLLKDTTPPSTPAWSSIGSATSSLSLSWTASTDNVGVVGYYLYRNGNQIPGIASPFTGTSYTDIGLSPGTTYIYKLAAYDAAGNLSYSNATSAVTLVNSPAPSVPNPPVVNVRSTNEIDITWVPPQNGTPVGYYVYENGTQIASVSSTLTSYDATGLSPSTIYLFSVAAYNAAGNVSGQSSSVQGTTLSPDTTPPSKPFNLAGVPASTSAIKLSWSGSTDNIGVTGYDIYRDGNQIATTGSTSTTYLDTGLATSTSHFYYVAAYDAAGNTSPQATVYNVWTDAVNPVVPVTPAPPVTTPLAPAAPTTPATPPAAGTAVFTTLLSYGSQGVIVTTLQEFLIKEQDLGPNYATGFYGSLTQRAVQLFQCAQAIVCSGNPDTTGWGLVGVRTRKALNALY